MNLKDLSEKWYGIPPAKGGEFQSLRIDGEVIADMFLGLNPELRRCVLIKIPANYTFDFQASIKQNVSLELYPTTNFIVLTLLSDEFTDLFNDLVFSIYTRILTLSDAEEYVSEFIKTYYKWNDFFNSYLLPMLSEEAIMGIVGELIFLKELIGSAPSSKTNQILSSWRGPFDTGHDFILDNKNVEVKTKRSSSNNIRISSEYQLQPEQNKGLELAVISITLDISNGVSLKEILYEIKELTISRLGDYSILLQALSQKGLTALNVSNFDHMKFRGIDMTIYDCLNAYFPKLIQSELSSSITGVAYNINTTGLKDHIITLKTF